MSEKSLINKIEELIRSDVSELVNSRSEEFKKLGNKGNNEWFSELCFCILTANSSARLSIKIQKELGLEGFLKFSEVRLSDRLKEMGYRFYNKRADFIVKARSFGDIQKSVRSKDEKSARIWLSKNIKGVGYKEASHFLRNVGYDNVAILDRHVLRVMHEHNLIGDIPKTLTRNRYLLEERSLERIASEVHLTLAKLDLYLWYMETGEILK